jgi:hypothetical protein
LWTALHEATPEIALHSARGRLAELASVGDLDYRLYRRVIEILDGQLALRPYVTPEVRRAAEQLARRVGVRVDQLEPTIDALVLHTALRAKATGAAADAIPAPTDRPDRDADLAAETRRLVAVADAFVRSAGLPEPVAESLGSGTVIS